MVTTGVNLFEYYCNLEPGEVFKLVLIVCKYDIFTCLFEFLVIIAAHRGLSCLELRGIRASSPLLLYVGGR